MLAQGKKSIRRALAFLGKAFSLPLGTIFFIPNPWVGVLLWLALFQNPRYGAFAILGLAVGTGVEKALRAGDAIKLGGGLKANALLTAVMVAWLTGASDISLGAQLLIAAGSAAVAAILAAAIMHALKETSLPSLVWGYCLVAAMLFSICPNCAVLASNATLTLSLPVDAMGWLVAFIRSLGSLIYAPSHEAGLIVGLAILLWSRVLFFTGLVGWLSGVCLALAFERFGIAYDWLPMSYNYFIAGMALGSVYFLPGRASLMNAVVGGCGASFFGLVLQYVLPYSSIAYLPIAAAISIWVVIGAVTLAGDRCVLQFNNTPYLRPEEAWWRMAYWSQRFGDKEVLFSTPVGGELLISQGFNGSLSHAGDWRHALDFQRPITVDGSLDPALNIWGAPIYAPASGMIERVKNTIPDNQLGVSNFAENWGNHVVIRLDQGGWALLAHLQQGSISVATGARIEAGDYLGKVGNSGRSPIPHLHLQAQYTPALGAPTVPFRLVNYLSTVEGHSPFYHWNAAALPVEEEVVMAAYPNQRVHALLAGIAPGTAVWSIETKGRIPSAFRKTHASNVTRLNIQLDTAGRHLFDSEFETGSFLASLAPDAWRIVETSKLKSPFMKLLALSVPSIPYAARTGMTWQDPVPIMSVGATNWLSSSVAPYLGRVFISANCECISEPNAESEGLQVATTFNVSQSSLPLKVTCRFEMLKGPVSIQADFEEGSILYSLLSFEPGLPFDRKDAR